MTAVVSPSDRRLRRRQNAAATAALVVWLSASFGLAPAVVVMVAGGSPPNPDLLPTWAWLTAWLAVVQFAYGVLIMQFAERESADAAAWMSAVVAAVDAALLAVFLFAGESSDLVGFLELERQVAGGQAAGWCVAMLCVSGTTSVICNWIGRRYREPETTTSMGEGRSA